MYICCAYYIDFSAGKSMPAAHFQRLYSFFQARLCNLHNEKTCFHGLSPVFLSPPAAAAAYPPSPRFLTRIGLQRYNRT